MESTRVHSDPTKALIKILRYLLYSSFTIYFRGQIVKSAKESPGKIQTVKKNV